ncbi:glycosyltransferase involved in cell wall biosynthesis/SAM-dependent methyltransferase [Paraburkholderia bannensis]|uniref:Glycosyltransferase involved in cell wall biosynthesis/SAM-dependent methyltransferase n=1 Tax=Paraburkholderia bannensis TaxID=765414 RepID=A0A7W9WTR3_9BURK|nr:MULTISPECIES: glycosyltransferase [Paraburkholderia]MBB3258020.1 glycosyltransferase involved in cell wall biosynthesis/SAM-dependent methyltransferase [Paraburkholderia sp. WP4_3_2]MBB6103033.1 glycosyltransferase involved in cell wall biosynthesis/SAM-dependent methyltransferase [Paraburkholderia bannensis]
MKFTGERFVPDQKGNIELEHVHRYLCAAELCKGKTVLDIACGEGYGSSLLARSAASVIGVDIAQEAVDHASQHHAAANLQFRLGSAAKMPIDDASIDVVVSFETIEHHDQHDEMMAEIRRVLRPGGLLIMSSPDRVVYSEIPGFRNEYHVKELTREEFETLVRASFKHVAIYGQRVVYASALLAEQGGPIESFRKTSSNVEHDSGLVAPMYLIAVASDAEVPPLASGVFETDISESDAVTQLKATIAARDHEIFEFNEGRTALEAAFHQVRGAEEEARAAHARTEEARAQAQEKLEQTLSALANAQAHAAEQATQLESATASINMLRSAARVQRTELTRLQAEKHALEASLSRLGASVEQLNAAVHAYRTSFSWRITAPVRVASRVARRGRNVARGLYRLMMSAGKPTFTPVHEMQSTGGAGFVSTGADPQVAVTPHWAGLRPGWAVLTVDMDSNEPSLNPVLYAFHGADGAQVSSYAMPGYGKGRERRLIVLPPDVRSLRFDPTDRRDVRFSLKDVSVRSIGRLGLVREGYAALSPEQRGQVWRALLGAKLRLAKTLVRSGIVGKYDKGEYRAWVETYDTLTEQDLVRLRELGDALAKKPLISVVMPVYNTRPKYLRKALDSVIAQTYPNWELCIADDASPNPEIRTVLEEYMRKDARIRVVFREKNGHISASTNSAIEIVKGEFVALMDHDDAIPAHTLFMVADEINRHPDVDLIYTDEDKVDENDQRHDPHFKTDWNRELFYSQNFIAHLGVYRTSIVRQIGGFRVGFEGSQDYDFALRFLKHTDGKRIRHIPHVLYHWRIFPGVSSFSTDNPDASVDTARRAMVEYFADVEPTSEVLPIDSFPGWWRIKRQPPVELPRVSLIVPTRDRVGVLRAAVDGLMHETNYENLEIIVVDNDSEEEETLEYFEQIKRDPRVKVLRVPGAFNFSALNNAAVEIATGSMIGFINNDIEIIHSDWLLEMVAQLAQPNVGAVGAKLYYANDTIQHAGVVLGLYGVAAHGHRHFPRNTIGYFGRPMLVQNMTAVTAACMLARKDVFEKVGGYDEINLTVGYNDVDLCLKIREAGYDVVYTPFAELYHLESISRGANLSAAQIERDALERAYMMSRWGNVIAHDPFYSPNLTVAAENYGLAFPPRAVKRWKDTDAQVR